jgi:hypothetical protein
VKREAGCPPERGIPLEKKFISTGDGESEEVRLSGSPWIA